MKLKKTLFLFLVVTVVAVFNGCSGGESESSSQKLYSVRIDSGISNGTVAADKTENLKKDTAVNLTVRADTGFILKTLSVLCGSVSVGTFSDKNDSSKYLFLCLMGM